MVEIISHFIQFGKMKINRIQILIILFSICGCNMSEQQTLKEFNTLKTEVKNNYKSNRNIFNELKSCFALKYIKVIEFKKNNNVAIEYKMNDSSKWEKIELNISNKEIKSPLKEEEISLEYFLDLKVKLSSINANRIWIIDDCDVTKGFNFKKFEIKYLKEVNDLHFFYTVFDRPLDSIEKSHYALLTQDNIGGVLDKDVIYYYK